MESMAPARLKEDILSFGGTEAELKQTHSSNEDPTLDVAIKMSPFSSTRKPHVSPTRKAHPSASVFPSTDEPLEGALTPSKYTRRFNFADDIEEEGKEFLPTKHLRGDQIVPLGNMEDVDIMGSPKSKRLTPVKAINKGRGEILTPEKALEIIIQERQAMDTEYTSLRLQNQELKTELDRRSNESTPAAASRKEVKTAPLSRETSEEQAWRVEAERVKRENETLKKQLRDNESKMQQQYDRMMEDISRESKLREAQKAEEAAANKMREDAKAATKKKNKKKIMSDSSDDEDEGVNMRSAAKVQLGTKITPLRTEVPSSANNDSGLCIPVRRMMWEGDSLWKVPFSSGGYPERRDVRLRRERRPGANSREITIVDDDGGFLSPQESLSGLRLFVAYPLTLIWYDAQKAAGSNGNRELVLNRDAHVIPGSKFLAIFTCRRLQITVSILFDRAWNTSFLAHDQ